MFPPFLQFCSFAELTVKADKKNLMHEEQAWLPQGKEDHSLCSSTEGKSAPADGGLTCKRGALYQSTWKENLLEVVERGAQVLCRAESRAQVTSNSHWKDDWFCSILLLPAKHCRMFSLLLASKFAAFVCQVLGLSNEHELPLMVHTYFPCVANPPFH